MRISDWLLAAAVALAFAIVGEMDYQDAELASNNNWSEKND